MAGLVDNVRIDLMYANIGLEPSLGSEILFILPEGFNFIQATVPDGSFPVSFDKLTTYIQLIVYAIIMIALYGAIGYNMVQQQLNATKQLQYFQPGCCSNYFLFLLL